MKKLLSFLTAMILFAAACKKDNPQSNASLTTTDATSITATTATTGGNITSDGGSGVAKRGVVYAMHATPTISDSITNDGTGAGTFSSSLTGLFPGTKYYVRAYAINGTGTGYGNEINFTTAPGMPTITTTVISGSAPLVVYSGGNVLSDGGSTVTARGLVWSTTEHPTLMNSKTTDGTGTGIFTDSLYPLASSTVYYVRAYATNSSGTAYGNEIIFTSSSADAVTDIDGNVYGYIKIGDQTWMTSNLKVSHYRNGDPITDGSANNSAFYNSWYITPSPTTGAFSYPGGDATNNTLYGKYYDVLDLQDPRGICPSGWHVPSDMEWKALEVFEGMSVADAADELQNTPRGNIGSKLLEGGTSGLNLQLAGYLYFGEDPPLRYLSFNPGSHSLGYYWTSTGVGPSPSWIPTPDPPPPPDGTVYSQFFDRVFNLNGIPGPIYRLGGSGFAMSVRCMKD